MLVQLELSMRVGAMGLGVDGWEVVKLGAQVDDFCQGLGRVVLSFYSTYIRGG